MARPDRRRQLHKIYFKIVIFETLKIPVPKNRSKNSQDRDGDKHQRQDPNKLPERFLVSHRFAKLGRIASF